ncbi:hypothetical protein SKAU_G00195920 [Synaphobranchus kaupii]|uniref:Uncharacterized protein n=1 Tax=Synaphobranchus kaupii TaxID=118154 RepID=A0A9Q1IXQ3_SYNKA|nr:hypothetical protein SKAU_G00195920 [Synaphobranchus kaupii]
MDPSDNTLRFRWKKNEEITPLLSFGRDVLFGPLCLRAEDIFCLQQNTAEGYFDVSLHDTSKLQETKALFSVNQDNLLLKDFKLEPLHRNSHRVLTVQMYNPWVTEETLRDFLAKYVTVLPGVEKIRDTLGIWTGERQFRIMLKEDPGGYHGFLHPPASFTIGEDEGHLIYAGQPSLCRKCSRHGHTAETCSLQRCCYCEGLGHDASDCSPNAPLPSLRDMELVVKELAQEMLAQEMHAHGSRDRPRKTPNEKKQTPSKRRRRRRIGGTCLNPFIRSPVIGQEGAHSAATMGCGFRLGSLFPTAMARCRAALPWQQAVLGMLLVACRGQCSVETVLSPDCSVFLYKGCPPAGLEHATLLYICQRLAGQPRFLTLYDTIDHIPVYSAYSFKRSDGLKHADVSWMYEPQLSGGSDSGEMKPFPQDSLHGRFEESQAVLEDYSNSVGFERGQLNPDEHQANPSDKAATYTLTNVVPQDRAFNAGPWNQQEHRVRQRLNNYCRGPAYIVTGVTTSGLAIRRRGFPRVAVPTYLWSAYCCPEYDRNAPYEERAKLPAFAAHGRNEPGGRVTELSLTALHNFLKSATYVHKSFRIFQDDCVPPPSPQR